MKQITAEATDSWNSRTKMEPSKTTEECRQKMETNEPTNAIRDDGRSKEMINDEDVEIFVIGQFGYIHGEQEDLMKQFKMIDYVVCLWKET